MGGKCFEHYLRPFNVKIKDVTWKNFWWTWTLPLNDNFNAACSFLHLYMSLTLPIWFLNGWRKLLVHCRKYVVTYSSWLINLVSKYCCCFFVRDNFLIHRTRFLNRSNGNVFWLKSKLWYLRTLKKRYYSYIHDFHNKMKFMKIFIF